MIRDAERAGYAPAKDARPAHKNPVGVQAYQACAPRRNPCRQRREIAASFQEFAHAKACGARQRIEVAEQNGRPRSFVRAREHGCVLLKLLSGRSMWVYVRV